MPLRSSKRLSLPSLSLAWPGEDRLCDSLPPNWASAFFASAVPLRDLPLAPEIRERSSAKALARLDALVLTPDDMLASYIRSCRKGGNPSLCASLKETPRHPRIIMEIAFSVCSVVSFFRCEGCGDGNELLPVLGISVVWFFMACMRKSQGKLYQLIRCTCSIDSTGAWWGETRPSGASRLPFRWPDQPRFRQLSQLSYCYCLWRQMWRCASGSVHLLPPPLQGTYCGPT